MGHAPGGRIGRVLTGLIRPWTAARTDRPVSLVLPTINTNRQKTKTRDASINSGFDRSTGLWIRSLVYGIMGMAPISTLALAILGLVPLHVGAPILVGTPVGLGVALLILKPEDRAAVSHGFVAGLVAVLIYDCTRMPFVVIGNWPDFIPKIGAWLTNTPQTHWSVGYLWRYLGNGAGMGLTFAMAVPFTDRLIGRQKAGLLYGTTIWTGLICTVLVAPGGQERLFALTPLTIAVSLTGHLVYGAVLGFMLGKRRPERHVEPLGKADNDCFQRHAEFGGQHVRQIHVRTSRLSW